MVQFWNSCISGIGGPIDIEQKGRSWSFMTMNNKTFGDQGEVKDLLDSDQGHFRCRREIHRVLKDFVKLWAQYG